MSPDKKMKLGTLELKIIAGLLTIIIGMLGYFGDKTLDKMEAHTKAMQRLEIAISDVSSEADRNTKKNDNQDTKIDDHEKRIIVLELKK